ncbi:MAG: CDP-glucose 4,6-dehydratase [Sulfurimicrobium sp.]|nr:CDP-glucose 4,6-dehydratase [Sulfurimicrobium sp.]
MESLGMMLFGGQYLNRRVLLTGHTGFKGSWLALWLKEMGADVVGIALPPESSPNHWDLLKLDMPDHRMDIQDSQALSRIIMETKPEIVFHLAAQALVRRSYREPLTTWATNVMGTANLLEACRQTESVRAIIVVTSDKCYENREWPWGYRENDRLGGHDPYSASKAASEILSACYRSAYFQASGMPLLATARAGNVIGGGDWSEDRLIPDLVRAVSTQSSLEIRSPHAARPWQHVLESLSGYLLLGQKLLEGRREFGEAWNFGPEQDSSTTVSDVLAALTAQWHELRWHATQQPQPHETTFLHLDSAKARSRLGWRPVWRLEEALRETAAWYRAILNMGQLTSREQLAAYISAARSLEQEWAVP